VTPTGCRNPGNAVTPGACPARNPDGVAPVCAPQLFPHLTPASRAPTFPNDINAFIPGLEAQVERDLPVYIQRHVYHRAEERMKPHPMTIFEEAIAISINHPEVSALPDGAFLIAMRYALQRIGYFVAEVIEDAVLLRTFLFLTQSGTPEGDRFNERLRIGNYEKRWFDLDRFSGYARTDLCEEPAFMEILKDCGLEGIKELVRQERFVNRAPDQMRLRGEEIRKILLAQSRFIDEPDVQ